MRFPLLEPVMTMRMSAMLTAALCALVLTACATGQSKRVSEPTASIQQLTVGADGNWTVELRLQNYSNVPMRFDHVALQMHAGDVDVGQLAADPALTIGPEAADVTTLHLTPSADARILVAGTLADRRSLNYSLEGTLSAAPKDRKAHDYRIKRKSALSPVPGLAGVMR